MRSLAGKWKDFKSHKMVNEACDRWNNCVGWPLEYHPGTNDWRNAGRVGQIWGLALRVIGRYDDSFVHR